MSDVRITGLSKAFGKTIAVRDVSFTCQDGKFTALMGPSGCGKTTLLRLIAGLEAADAGSIRIGQSDVTRLPPERRNIGLMFQSYALFPHMTVAENLAFPLRMRRKYDAAERTRRIARALDLVRLPAIGGRYPRQLSGGQQQRVAVARALIDEPSVLLLDEPLSNLDARLREEMQLELVEMRRQVPITTILVTHDQTEGLTLADEIVVMRDGRIEQSGAPRAVYANPATAFVADFLGGANLIPVEVTAAAAGCWQITFKTGATVLAEAGMTDRPGPAAMAVRQESIRILPGALEGGVSAEAAVTAVAYRGAFAQIAADALGQQLRFAAGPDARLAAGDKIRIGWRLADCRIIRS